MPAFDFATGNTNPETFPAEAFAEAARQVIPEIAVELNRYTGKLGYEGLRRLMARREFDREGVSIDPDRIALTNGSMQAINLITEALADGDDAPVVMEEYSYLGTIRYYDAIGVPMIGVPMDARGMRMDALAEAMDRLRREGRRARFIYTLATYQNPTGAMMPAARRRKLLAIAAAHDCIVVEDNCYGDVHFEGEKPPAFYALDDGPNQVYICSLSKIFAPGVRLGYITARDPIWQRILEFRNDAGPNTLSAAIVAHYLEDKLWDHVAMTNTALKRKRDAMLAALENHLGNLCSWSHPVGGLFLWLRLPDDVDVKRLAEIAEPRDITFADGSAFHVAGAAGPYIRLAFGFPSEQQITDGIAALGQAIQDAKGSAE